MNIKGLNMDNLPRGGDVMAYNSHSAWPTAVFAAKIEVLDIPIDFEDGYTPIALSVGTTLHVVLKTPLKKHLSEVAD